MTLKWKCNYCSHKPFLHFKALVNHYTECHKSRLQRLEIRNPKWGQVVLLYATTEEEALKSLGWNKNDCKIRRIE